MLNRLTAALLASVVAFSGAAWAQGGSGGGSGGGSSAGGGSASGSSSGSVGSNGGAAATKSLSSTNTGVMVNPNAAPPSADNGNASVAPAGRLGDKTPSRDTR
jgi:hypothetical protein